MPTRIYYRTIKYVNYVLCLLGTDCKKKTFYETMTHNVRIA